MTIRENPNAATHRAVKDFAADSAGWPVMGTVINHCEEAVSTEESTNLVNRFLERLVGKGACHDYQRCVPGILFERYQGYNFQVAKSRQDEPCAQKSGY